jgi:hypothetical protein
MAPETAGSLLCCMREWSIPVELVKHKREADEKPMYGNDG